MEEQVVQAGNQIYLYIGMGVTVAFVALDKAMAIISKKKNNGKNGRNNGNIYKYINENTTRSKLNEQKIENISSNMNKMDERNEKDHEKISNKLDEIIGKLK